MAFPVELRQLIWQVLLPILDIMSLRRNFQGVKMWMFLILEPAKLLGACKPGSRSRMDSRTGQFYFYIYSNKGPPIYIFKWKYGPK